MPGPRLRPTPECAWIKDGGYRAKPLATAVHRLLGAAVEVVKGTNCRSSGAAEALGGGRGRTAWLEPLAGDSGPLWISLPTSLQMPGPCTSLRPNRPQSCWIIRIGSKKTGNGLDESSRAASTAC